MNRIWILEAYLLHVSEQVYRLEGEKMPVLKNIASDWRLFRRSFRLW